MTGLDIFNVVSGVVGIISFIFVMWIWFRSDWKIRELLETIQTIHDIAGTALWQDSQYVTEDLEMKFHYSQRILGFVSSIRELTARFSKNTERIEDINFGFLIEKGIIWSTAMIWEFEASRKITEIWVITPDLKPDASNETIGRLVHKNIANGKKYVFFYPDDLVHKEVEILRLKKNLNLKDSITGKKLSNRVFVVGLNRMKHDNVFSRANTVLYFLDKERSLPARCFEEIVLTQVSDRGAFWQEHPEIYSKKLRATLTLELEEAIRLDNI